MFVHVGNFKRDTVGCILAAYEIDDLDKPTHLVNSRNMTNYLFDTYEGGQISVKWL